MTKYRIVHYTATNRYHIEKEGWFFWSEFKVLYNQTYKSRFVFETEAKKALDAYLVYINQPKIVDTSTTVYEVEVD